VTVEHEDGTEKRYRLVGPDEFDVDMGLISVDAPLGRSLLGKRKGDVVRFLRPAGAVEVTLVRVSWKAPA
jgi:transcription elongation factor GreB